jgi:hypothetical protein
VSLVCGFRAEREKARCDTARPSQGRVRGSAPSGRNREESSTDARCAGGPARSSCEALVMGAEPRGGVVCDCVRSINQTVVGLGGVA